MPNDIDCPALALYRDLAAGAADVPQHAALLAHLENCPACLRQVEALPGGALLVQGCRTAPEDPGELDPYATAYPPASLVQTDPLDGEALLSPRPAQELLEFLAPAQQPDELGRLGPFRVLQILGTGGMGVVFRAEDGHLQRPVALKTMLPALAGSAEAKQRFLREARAAAALKDERIVTIYQVGEDRGVPYLAMELLEGESLDACLEREGKLPLADVLHLGREAALALAAAHEHGLIHRDIKPANMFLEVVRRPNPAVRARVKLLDFGLAWVKQQEGRLTQKGMIVGTPAYMAPEQTQGQAVDFRCDLFSLGCVLYQAATGRRPFDRSDVVSTLLAVANDTPPAPHTLDGKIPVAFSELVMQLLAKNPADRVTSASALAQALAELERGTVLVPVPASAPVARPRRPLPQGNWLANVRAAHADSLPEPGTELEAEELVDRLLEALGPTAPLQRKDAAKARLSHDLALHAIRNPASECAMPALLKLIKVGWGPYKRLASECLRQVGPTEAEAADFLVGKLQDADIRAAAVTCLERIGPTTEASVPLLLRALDDEDETIRSWAVTSLHRIGPAAVGAVGRLLSTMKGSPPEIRVQIIDALAAIGGEPAILVPRLVHALKHKVPVVRAHAAVALRRFAAAAADFLPALQAAAQDDNDLVRQSAQATLQEIRRETPAEPARPRTPALIASCTCGKRLRFPPAFGGKRVRCPGCGRAAMLPPAKA